MKWKNGGFISYGQSGAGKTYTIFGKEDASGKGIAHRAVAELLKILSTEALGCEVSISFYEVYVDQIRDLIAPPEEQKIRSGGGVGTKSSSNKIEFYDSLAGETEVNNMTKAKIKSEADLAAVIRSGVRKKCGMVV